MFEKILVFSKLPLSKIVNPKIGLRFYCTPKPRAIDINPGLSSPKYGTLETDEEFDERYYQYFSKPDIDGWEIRKGINDLHWKDLIPEPKIICALLKACRRNNDHSLAVRYLEAVRHKADCCNKEIYPWLLQEIKPTLDELGISTPTELGYDEPEYSLPDPYKL